MILYRVYLFSSEMKSSGFVCVRECVFFIMDILKLKLNTAKL